MKNILIILFYLLSQPIISIAQDCPTKDIPLFYIPKFLEDFAKEYPNCKCLPSSLKLPTTEKDLTKMKGLSNIDSIRGSLICQNCELNSLMGLENIKYIERDLIIDGPSGIIKDLQGLNNLKEIKGSLIFYAITELKSLEGLNSLKSIGRSLDISNCNKLRSIKELENLKSIGRDLIFYRNDRIQVLNSFISLENIGGDLKISNNDFLTTIADFNKVKIIGGRLEIAENPILSEISGFNSLNSINGNIYIGYCKRLKNLDALSSVVQMDGDLSIISNDSLIDIRGLENIDVSEISGLTINYNSNLSICNNKTVCNYLKIGYSKLSIVGNAGDCAYEHYLHYHCNN